MELSVFVAHRPIDLRSDTITRPDSIMRQAMADAEVGDDVLDHDPTMAALEERVADLLGFEAALWVPSGSMGNIIALMLHLQRGDRFLAPEHAHVLGSELGTAAWLAGGMPEALPHDGGPGRPLASTVRAAAGGVGPYFALRTTLLSLENTHNFAGGAVLGPDEWAELVAAGRDSGLRIHLDGARLWNAAVALDVPIASLTAGADTVQVCLSKGLGAPVGSMLVSDAARIHEARRVRKMLGGGVRQGGVLAAAGLVALDRIGDLAEDHANASTLARGLRERGWEVAEPQTNIVLAAVADPVRTVTELADLGIAAVTVAGKVRFVTHRDVSAADIDEVLERLRRM
ncbi:low specificity L-threonine aldolase [Rhodococcus fascians]|jgi:threonine aldolase|uniref:threonine aldolase family protein n=1 Tax=Rhodococcoides fascians TaxID=1828 RepID=UPI001C92AB91|nr:low specificity L-threonine aldolase [Rhodococcus fascians]MBY4138575.1 low specificity L-threonine aldolase [Rhodococcus fascians]MBY4218219.1 low specificity L-threonine aldolase [Rhodococcus fascians]MBY4221051.1 low specificity L-threonine aldolase [Rhodococcus fascians]MBY4231211.1 low specificity L-threonine aldolase [Rhodococcus fascians]